MNQLSIASKSEQITMTSREIAELVGSRHDKVKQSIQRLSSFQFNDDRTVKREPVISEPPMGDGAKSANGTVERVYIFAGEQGKRDSFVVVAQLCPEFTARLVDRWQELEKQVAQPSFQIPASLSEALRLAADQAEQIEQQQALIEQQKPAVQFVDQYVESTGLKGFRQVAKLLKANERELRDFLISHKIMYRIGGEWTAYQNHIDAGRFQSKTGTNETNGHAYTRAMFTPKGVNWLAGLWAQYQISKQDEVAA